MADVLLLGMGLTTLSALESLTQRIRVVGVVRPPSSVENALDPVVELARGRGVPLYADARPSAVTDLVERLRPDCVVVSSYDRILRPEVLRLSKFVNVHYAPLPSYRGRANVNWAVINGETHAAISIHAIVPGLDSGPVLFQKCVPISAESTVRSLYDTLNELQRVHLATTVLDYLSGRVQPREQNEAEATYGCTRVPSDGEIDWGAASRKISALVRGLVDPFPGAFTFVGGRRLFIRKAAAVTKPPRYVGRVPGRVIGYSKAAGTVDVLSGDGVVRLYEVQFEGEKKKKAADAVASVRETFGLRTAELLDRVEVLERTVLRMLERQSRERHEKEPT